MSFDLIETTDIYHGRVFTVRRDRVRLPNGKSADVDIVQHHGAVTLVPVDEQGRIWFVRQYRHAAGETLLELPAGTLDDGEEPEACAAREIREEIGMAAGQLRLLGQCFLAPGYSTEFMHFYLATQLRPESAQHDDDEFLDVETMTVEEAYAMALGGRIRDAKTLAALLLAQPHVKRRD